MVIRLRKRTIFCSGRHRLPLIFLYLAAYTQQKAMAAAIKANRIAMQKAEYSELTTNDYIQYCLLEADNSEIKGGKQVQK